MRDSLEAIDTGSGSAGDGAVVAAALLRWYDRAARVLPWRTGPAARAGGQRPDPYRVWLSEIMLQQTTVASVRAYFHRFTTRWPDIHALAGADDAEVMAEWAGLGYYARARNLIACARAVAAAGGAFPTDCAGLQALPGIGPYTAAAIAAIAFDARETVVDGNVERVTARLFAVTDPLPGAKKRLTALAGTLTPAERPGDFAQAMMDLGATVCTPRAPRCAVCPLQGLCAGHARGIAADLPAKTPKAAKPTRLGTVYMVLRDDGAPLIETRPPRGLLGGMPGFPTTDWTPDAPPPAPPLTADWQLLPGEVRHTFTHFHLQLRVALAHAGPAAAPDRGSFRPGFDPAALPTLMRKCWDHVRAHLSADAG
ncbi:A/G-specific adenine glycosylase [Pararhodobacter sp. SW119]|uniref:A/G-specific adenine glycosylase n=1 Tax=Pararhodobacter sp. SW119 TaxID=2780075 RepID=UPI001AE0CB80|nr:A/G-specific adenine glycosylase [Pararhodobacter sp. SW119]